jgi:hypothetical protein
MNPNTTQTVHPEVHDIAEASELGLAPGCWPTRLTYRGASYGRMGVDRTSENELIAVHYICVTPFVTRYLTVYND